MTTPIVGILGKQGMGKTMLMTYYGIQENNVGKRIFSNYHLNGIDYTPIVSLNDLENMRNGVFLGDELWLWIWSRISMSKINKEINKIVMLNRKRNVSIYYTAQLSRSVDVMLREVTDYFLHPFIIPHKYNNTTEKYCDYHLHFYSIDISGINLGERALKHDIKYWGQFYDTTQEISSLKDDNDKAPIKKGIALEEKFVTALKKMPYVKHIDHLPNSGATTSWNYDVIAYAGGKTLAFDVKSCGERVYIDFYGKDLRSRIKNAYNHNAIPFLAFPMQGRKQHTNPKFWYIYKLDFYSYILNLSSNPMYNKLAKNSHILDDLKNVIQSLKSNV